MSDSTSRDHPYLHGQIHEGDSCEIVYLSDRTLIRFSGEIDMAMSGIKDVADVAIGAGKPVVVDVTGVTFMDSVGCGFLARLIAGTRPHRVRVVGANHQVSRLLWRMGMPHHLDLHAKDPVDAAQSRLGVDPGLNAALDGALILEAEGSDDDSK